MNKEERKEEALKLKGDHKIYLCIEEDCPEMELENIAEVCDLANCIEPKNEGERWMIPDYTPDWLYDILELYGGCELMESIFTFDSKEIIAELSEICDTVIEEAGV